MAQTTNTNGVIAAAAAKMNAPAESKSKTPAQILNNLFNNAAIQRQLNDALKENSGAFVTSVMNIFNNDKLLQMCEPRAVLAESLKAVALKIPIEKQLGFAYIVPFKDHGVPKPQFQLGYKGYIQLALRTGAYRHINADVVYDGELKSVDKLKGEIDLSGERISDEIIGYFAYIETVDGYRHTLYWSKEKVIAHAKRYSKSFQKGSAIWNDNFDEMAVKTVLRNLLSHYGVMSVEMSGALSADAVPAEIEEQREPAAETVIEVTAEEIEEEIPEAEAPAE